MMAVFLKVLAFIGIVLLAILGLILLVLLLILFVPVRYRVDGSFKENKPTLSARVTWLLHFVSIRYNLGDETPLTIRILGIKLKDKEEKIPDFDEESKEDYESFLPSEKSQVEIHTDSESIPESIAESIPKEVSDPVSDIYAEPEISAIEEPLIEPKPEISEESATEEQPKSSESHKKTTHKNNDFQKPKFYDKIKKYIEIIESRRFKKVFEYSKKKVFKVLKHIRPRHIDIKGEVGFEDPSLTGTVIAITSMMIPVFGDKIRITGNFEEPVINVTGRLKGRITIMRVLWTLAVLYFNRDLRKIIKMFREV